MSEPRELQYLSAIAGEETETPKPGLNDEYFLAKMAGQDVETPKAVTRRQKYYKKIIDNGGGGGSLTDLDTIDFGNDPTLPEEGKTDPQNYEDIADAINTALERPNAVTIEPLSVTANDIYTESGKAYNPVTVNVPNPNSVVTVNGTLANPWGEYGYAALKEAYLSNGLSVFIVFSGNVDNWVITPKATTFPLPQYDFGSFTSLYSLDGNNGAIGAMVTYFNDGSPGMAIEQEERETYNLPWNTPCTTYLIFHPLPTV